MKLYVAILGILLLSGCGKSVARLTTPAPRVPDAAFKPAIIEHVNWYELGISAFREFTPEGYRRAIGYFRRASDLAPDICDYRLHLAQANLFLAFEQASNLDDFSGAFDQSQPPACGADTAFAQRLEAMRSLALFRLGHDRLASIALINGAIERDPDNALNWLVAWELGIGTFPDTTPISQPPDVASDLALIHYSRGRYWLLRGDFAKARKSFENALQLSPRHFRSYVGLAEAAAAQDTDEDIEGYYKKAVEIAPDFLLGRTDLGDYYSWISETRLAEEQYLAALKHNPRYVPAYLGLGQAYWNAGRLDEAEKTLRTAIDVAPDAYEAHYYLGNVWMDRNNLDKAKEQYEAALLQVPVYPEALYALGVVFGQKNDYDSALEQFEKVLRASSKNAGAYLWRAVIRADREQFAEANEDSTRAVNLYDEQIGLISKSIENAERHGRTRRAESERKKKDRLEETRQRALGLKTETGVKIARQPER
jgi:tetratricopeptide (TPR) repeat protein